MFQMRRGVRRRPIFKKKPKKLVALPSEQSKKTYPSVAVQEKITWLDARKLLPGPYHYNSSVIERDDGYWLAYRDQNQARDSRIGITRLDGLSDACEISLPQHFPREQREDPRLFWFGGQIWMSYGAWDNAGCAAVALVELDRDWQVTREVRASWMNNWGSHQFQKNWCFFEHEKSLHCVYSPTPHEIIEFNASGTGRLVSRERGVEWAYGLPRGGTPPVLHEDRYWSFFHSRLLTPSGRFRYFMGLYAFSKNPPFKPELVTPEPLLAASDADPNLKFLPLVVFPCGAVVKNGEWIVSLGVNDVRTALWKVRHDELSARMVRCT